MPEEETKKELFILRVANSIYNMIDRPITFVREKIVEPNQQQYPWYHKKYRRVPTIDECDEDDVICHFEANYQYLRDRAVDTHILVLLKDRHQECMFNNMEDPHLCDHLWQVVEDAHTNWNIKHGELGGTPHVFDAFMKQKHRMIWERRHGKVGTGMRNPDGSKKQL